MELCVSRNIHFLIYNYIFGFLVRRLQEFLILKKITSLKIGLNWIIREYNQAHIIQMLRTQVDEPVEFEK